jgi:hypothetical protein
MAQSVRSAQKAAMFQMTDPAGSEQSSPAAANMQNMLLLFDDFMW